MPPELVIEQPYDQTADLWSLGVVLYELFHGEPPFYTNNIVSLVKLIVHENVKWPPKMRPVPLLPSFTILLPHVCNSRPPAPFLSSPPGIFRLIHPRPFARGHGPRTFVLKGFS